MCNFNELREQQGMRAKGEKLVVLSVKRPGRWQQRLELLRNSAATHVVSQHKILTIP
jgi:hypothetical protein